jgi:hypothetical protein
VVTRNKKFQFIFVAEKYDKVSNKRLSSINIYYIMITILWGKWNGNTSSKRKRNYAKFPTVKEKLVHVFFKWIMVGIKPLLYFDSTVYI